MAEVTAALGVTETTISFYDFRHPEADTIVLHWLYLEGSGNQQSTLTLPLANTYRERGYAFCTALSNSQFRLNGELIDEQDSITEVIYRRGALRNDQLRAGQSNSLSIEALSLFGTGFLGGVSTVISGTTAVESSGGYTRVIELQYPSVLGPPLTIREIYLPLLFAAE